MEGELKNIAGPQRENCQRPKMELHQVEGRLHQTEGELHQVSEELKKKFAGKMMNNC